MQYQEGQTATNPQTGEKVIFQGGGWTPERANVPTETDYPGVIRGPQSRPDPMEQAAEQRARNSEARDQVDQTLQIEGVQESRSNTDFSQATTLRTEFTKLPAVREYGEIVRQYANARSAGENAAGDQSLIVSYAKMLDPGSTVREGEFDTTARVDNEVNRLKSEMQRQFGWDGAGRLSPKARQWLIGEMHNLTTLANRRYMAERERFRSIADRNGFDAGEVLGPHPGAALFKELQRKGRAGGPNGLGREGNEAEQKIVAFWNDNAGNTNLTVEQVKSFYDQNGLYPPSDEDIQATIGKSRSGETFGGVEGGIQPEYFTSRQEAEADRERAREFGGSANVALGDMSALGAQGVTLGLTDEVSGVGQVIGDALTGNLNNFGESYRRGRDRERERVNIARENLGGFGTALEFAGAGGAVKSGAGAVMRAGRSLGAGNVTRQGVQQQMIGQSTREGAALGAVGGFGYGEGATGSAVNALAGAALGGAVGNVAQRGSNALANKNALLPDKQSAAATARAGEAEGIPVNRMMVDPSVENTFTGVETTRVGGPRVAQALDDTTKAIEGRVTSLGRAEAMDQEAIGAAVQQGASASRQKTRAQASRFYDKADDAAGGVAVQPTKAMEVVDRNIAELQASGANANRGQIKYLQDIREDLAGGMTVRGLRDQRTNLRGQINERNLAKTDAERRIGQVLDAASEDISSALAGNARAKNLFTKGDELWREQSTFAKQIEKALVGAADNPKSGTEAARKIESMVRSDAPRFKRLWDALDDESRDRLSGYFAENLGRNAKGEWSPALFLNSLPKGSQRKVSERTLRIMFGDEGVESLANLRTLSEQVNRLQKARNNSRTGASNDYRSWLWEGLGLMGGGAGGLLANGASTGTLALAGAGAAAGAAGRGARDALNARMLTSPKVQKWLLSAPRTANPKAIDQHFAKLSDIARTTPTLSNEIGLLKNAIKNAANDATDAALVASTEGSEEN